MSIIELMYFPRKKLENMPFKFVEGIKQKLKTDEHFAELVKSSGIAFGLRILGLISGYVFTLLVTRTLGARAWGIFALCLVILQVSSVIGRLGMDTALLRFTAEYVARSEVNVLKNIYKNILKIIIPFSIFIAFFVYLLSPILASKVFHKLYLTNYFRIVSFVIVPFVLLWIHTEGIRGLKKIKDCILLRQTGIFFIATIIFLCGLLLFKTEKLPLLSYSISVFIISTLAILTWNKYLKAKILSTKEQANQLTPISYRYILSVSIPMLLSSSLFLIMNWTDTIMLGIFRSAKDVGIYNVAVRLATITSLSLMAVNTIAAPKFAEFWGKGDLEGLKKVVRQSTKLIFWTSAPVLILYLIFPKWFMGLFGQEFKKGALALIFLTIGQFINAASGSVGYILSMTGNQKLASYIMLIATLLNFVLNVLLIPIYGINGSAIASTISLAFWNLTFAFFVYKKLGIISILNIF